MITFPGSRYDNNKKTEDLRSLAKRIILLEHRFQMTTIALQAHLKQNLTFSGSLRQNLSPHSHPPNLSLDTQISSHRISKQPQREVSNTQVWQETDCKMS